MLGEIPECAYQSVGENSNLESTEKQKYYLSIEMNQAEKEVTKDIKDEVQKKLILPDPSNRTKPHTSHLTLGVLQFHPEEEQEVIKLIEGVLQDSTDLREVDLTHYRSFKNDAGQTTTIHLEPTSEHTSKLTKINQKLKDKLGTRFKSDNFGFTPHLTLFQAKETAPLPDLTQEDLNLCATDSINTSGKGAVFEPERKLRVVTHRFGLRKLGTSDLIAEYNHDLDTSTIVMSTPSSLTNQVSNLVWRAKNEINSLGKAKATSHLANRHSD